MSIVIRKLNASEIDCRVATVTEDGCSLLLYKDARVDQNILDETFGIFGWQREHMIIGDNLYCKVSVKNPDTGEWVSKQDVGTESYTEKEKGQASDSFKRACFNLGIGRELYTAPFIWIKKGDCKVKEVGNGKYTTKDRFEVTDIGYDDEGNINHLVIYNTKTNCKVFTLGQVHEKKTEEQLKDDFNDSKVTMDDVKTILNGIAKANISAEEICKKYKVKELKDLTQGQYLEIRKDVNEAFEKAKGKK